MASIMNLEYERNSDINKQLLYELNDRLKTIYSGGGEKAAAKQTLADNISQ